MRVRRFYVSRSVASVACHVDLAWIGCVLWCFTCRVGSGATRGGPLWGLGQLYDRFAAAQRRTRTFGKNTARGASTDRPGEGRNGARNTPQPHSKQTPQRARHDVVILPYRTAKSGLSGRCFSLLSPVNGGPPPLNRSKVRLRRLGVQPSPCTSIRAAVRAPRSRAEVISQAAQSAKVQLNKVPAA